MSGRSFNDLRVSNCSKDMHAKNFYERNIVIGRHETFHEYRSKFLMEKDKYKYERYLSFLTCLFLTASSELPRYYTLVFGFNSQHLPQSILASLLKEC